MKTFSWRRFVTRATAALSLAGAVLGASAPASARDPWLQPFHEDSIWNTPIGNNADYIYANLVRPEGQGSYPFFVGFDPEYLERPSTSDPLRDLLQAGSFFDRDGSENGYTPFLEKFRIRDSLVVDDVTFAFSPNNAAAFRDTDGRTVRQLNALTRTKEASQEVYGYRKPIQNLYKKGLYGGHSGSGLSTIGGSIRKGELLGDAPIRHVLKLMIQYQFMSPTNGGFRWPAANADAYYNREGAVNRYTGSVPQVRMGALMAIKPEETASSLGLETPPAIKIMQALKDFGAYLVDDAAWDGIYWGVEVGVDDELKSLGYDLGSADNAFKRDMTRLMAKLHVVDDNGPFSIGGDGTRRVDKLEPLGPVPQPAGALSRSGWNAYGAHNNAGNVLDGNLSTVATTPGNQNNQQAITIDMGALRTFDRILLETNVGSDENRYPRKWVLWLSDTNDSWGQYIIPNPPEYADSFGARQEGETEILLDSPRTARYITIQQEGFADVPWSIAELNVFNRYGTSAPNPTPTPSGTFYRIKSRWEPYGAPEYLFDGGELAKYSWLPNATDTNYHWSVEVTDSNHTRFRNRATGDVLNVQNLDGGPNDGNLRCTPGQDGWWSSRWSREPTDNGFERFNNAWQTGQYIHIENLRGNAQYGSINSGWLSAQWTLEAVSSSPAPSNLVVN